MHRFKIKQYFTLLNAITDMQVVSTGDTGHRGIDDVAIDDTGAAFIFDRQGQGRFADHSGVHQNGTRPEAIQQQQEYDDNRQANFENFFQHGLIPWS